MTTLLRRVMSKMQILMKYNKLKKLNSKDYEKFLEDEYYTRTGNVLNFENLQKYTEKMQYAKIYLGTAQKTTLSDKYLVRKWVGEKIGNEYLIPLYGVWDKFSDIDFNELPSKFVLKTTHSSGWNEVVTDKKNINMRKVKPKFNYWMKLNYAYYTDLQLHYKNIKPRIIAEKFIQDKKQSLYDYRFLCFGGKAYYCWVDVKSNNYRFSNVYDLNWKLQSWELGGLSNSDFEVDKPENFEKMIQLAETLAEGFSHVRVDLYNIDGHIYFGEMTFTSTGGYRLIKPEHYDYMLGGLWDLKAEKF
ncbi:ATP-grasp fold amidoligase family protein [Aerococcus urinaeequi]|uniref:ATP-grasp fold amidoligase family protein n=1 Tax=Aerococcus urinaeequi TaxID=51665 RepID=UPI003B4F163D